MPRRPRFASAGYAFHVLNRGAGRQTLFHEQRDYDAFVNLLEEARGQAPMRVLAYCLMPNHWHLVLWPETDDALSAYMHWLTTTHCHRWQAFYGSAGCGPVYQGRFKSFPVQADDHFLAVCRYVERNALRAGIVSRAELWKWSSLWQRVNNSPAVALSAWPVPLGATWLEYVNEPQNEMELATIRNSVNRGRPYGSATWVREVAKRLGLESTLRSRGNPRKRAR